MLKRRIFKSRDGERIIRERYFKLHGRELDLERAYTFTDKLYRRMIEVNRSGNPTFTRLVDKYLVRDYVRDKIGSAHLVPLLWSGTEPSKIPFDELPSKYIVKTNHGSGWNMLVDQSTDRRLVIEKMQGWLAQNYYWILREYQYFNVEPRILVERFLEPGGKWPLDYRIWCFDGKPEVIQVDNHAHSINRFYDLTWNRLSLHYRHPGIVEELPRPSNLDEMLSAAARLSGGFDFVRIDMYSVGSKVYFGEMTFMPAAGMFRLMPEEWEARLGEKWNYSPGKKRRTVG
jgi:teichuronopeptide biosynthesis TupA-like protein